MQVKYISFAFYSCFLFIKNCWNYFCFFIVWFYNFVAHNCWTIHNTCYIFSIFKITCSRIPNIIFFTFMTFFTYTSTFTVIPPLIELHFLPSNLRLHSHVNVFYSIISIIILNTLWFKSWFIWNTYFIRWVIKSITSSNTSL